MSTIISLNSPGMQFSKRWSSGAYNALLHKQHRYQRAMINERSAEPVTSCDVIALFINSIITALLGLTLLALPITGLLFEFYVIFSWLFFDGPLVVAEWLRGGQFSAPAVVLLLCVILAAIVKLGVVVITIGFTVVHGFVFMFTTYQSYYNARRPVQQEHAKPKSDTVTSLWFQRLKDKVCVYVELK